MHLTLLKSLTGLSQHLVTDYKQVVELLEEGIAKRYDFYLTHLSLRIGFIDVCFAHGVASALSDFLMLHTHSNSYKDS